MIEDKNCNFFIDDLPNILEKLNNNITKIWFSKKKHKLFFNSSEWIKIQKFINNEIETNYRFKTRIQ